MSAIEANILARVNGKEFTMPSPDRPGRYVAFAGDSEDPHPIHLLSTYEVLLERKPVEIQPCSPMPPLEGLMRITQAASEDEIGIRPVLAAVNTEENEGNHELELFRVFFARDAIKVAEEEIDEFPQIAKTTIKTIASTQGTKTHLASEAERGKVVHEDRPSDDPIARRLTIEKGWEWPYYGAIDPTPCLVSLIDTYVQNQNDNSILDERYIDRDGEEQDIRHAAKLAIEWVEGRVNKSPAGLLEYKQETTGGIENQVWRDSWDSYHHADGTLADNTYGIASFSAQIDAYKAFKAASRLFPEKSGHFLQKAQDLKRNIMNFWVEDENGGYFALGSERKEDDSYELLKIQTSDMGHILDSDILEGDDPEILRKRDMLVATLFSPNMLATSGIRTLGKNELRYNSGAYHNGSVWPRENSKIARGLARHGYYNLAYELHKRNANIWKTTGVFPEKVSGSDSHVPQLSRRIVDVHDIRRGPYRAEQPGQLVQAWSDTSIRQSLKFIEEYEKLVMV